MVSFPIIRFVVRGESMAPEFWDGRRILVNRLSYLLREPKRGEVVIARDPRDERRKLLKRIEAAPGDIVDGARLGPDEYFVRGDNEGQSTDSRSFGPITRDLIKGKVVGCLRGPLIKNTPRQQLVNN